MAGYKGLPASRTLITARLAGWIGNWCVHSPRNRSGCGSGKTCFSSGQRGSAKPGWVAPLLRKPVATAIRHCSIKPLTCFGISPWPGLTVATPKLLYQLGRIDLLIVDDWAMAPLAETERRDFLEICDARYQARSTLLTSQIPVASWHAQIGDPTIADSILDRLVHNAHRLELKGESMRKKRGAGAKENCMTSFRRVVLSIAERGEGTQTPSPRPTPHSPLPTPRSEEKTLTDADH